MREETIDGTFDGPRTLVHDEGETRWEVTPARATAELEARARLAAHPLVSAAVTRRGDALVFPPLTPISDPSDALDAIVDAAGTAIETSSSVRDLLHAFGGPVDAVRGLGRSDVPRSVVDRFLGRTLTVRTPRGIDLGAVMPAAIRETPRGLLAVSVRYGRAEGWPVLDLASLALRGALDGDGAHAAIGGDDDTFDVARAHQALRELAAVRDEPRREPLRALVRAVAERFASAAPSKPRRAFSFEPRAQRRKRLFTRFFEGIRYDDEGLFSATPEALALRLVEGLEGVVVDATCGIGSLAIALARASKITRVIAIDRDPERLRMAAHNASIYGVAERIEFRLGDALVLVPTLRFDGLVIDPPWGGRDYDRARVALDDLDMPLTSLLAAPGKVVLKLPRSFDASTLPAGFEIEPLVDDRGVLKMLVARRGLRSPVPA